MSRFLWGVYPYICILLFLAVPVIRMVFRPYSWSTRTTSLFGAKSLGRASLLLHWGLVLLLFGHLAGLIGGVLGLGGFVTYFYWTGLLGGLMTLAGSIMALIRRYQIPEVRAMSQPEDYIVHFFFIVIVSLALWQVLANQIFGVAYTASAWAASLWTLSPQPELMVSAGLITKVHVLLALTFFAYFPFTKLVHVWTIPIYYFKRPYQSVRTVTNRFRRKWEFSLRSDKSFLTYSIGLVALIFIVSGALLGLAEPTASSESSFEYSDDNAGMDMHSNGTLMGGSLYVSQCARCHGMAGLGDGEGADSRTFTSPPRNLVEGHYRFVGTSNGVASNADLHRTISRGLDNAGMPAFEALSDAQIDSLVVTLDQLWQQRPTPGHQRTVPPRPQPTLDDVETGSYLFQTRCRACHGEEGRGDGPLASFIQDWQQAPVAPADLTSGNLKAGGDADRLYLRVAAGVGGGFIGGDLENGVTGYLMPPFFDDLSEQEIWQVVSYLEAHVLR